MGKYDYTAKDLCKAQEESTSDKILAAISFIAFIIIVAWGL